MTTPAPDLSRLRINRDVPAAPLRRALWLNLLLGLVAVVLLAGFVRYLRWEKAVPVETAVASAVGGGSGPGSASVTANGYVVARTRASVSSKVPGRLAELRVTG